MIALVLLLAAAVICGVVWYAARALVAALGRIELGHRQSMTTLTELATLELQIKREELESRKARGQLFATGEGRERLRERLAERLASK